MLEKAERAQATLDRNGQAQNTHLKSVLAAVAALSENMAQIGQERTRNDPHSGVFASTTPQQLPMQLIIMAPAIPIVQPQGVAPPAATYQVAQPLGAVQPQMTPYQTGMRPTGAKYRPATKYLLGNSSASTTAVRSATSWGQERRAGPLAATDPGSGWPLRAATSASTTGDPGISSRICRNGQG